MKIAHYVMTALAICAALDIMIVLWTVLAISVGTPVEHIPFWDAQIKLVLSIMH